NVLQVRPWRPVDFRVGEVSVILRFQRMRHGPDLIRCGLVKSVAYIPNRAGPTWTMHNITRSGLSRRSKPWAGEDVGLMLRAVSSVAVRAGDSAVGQGWIPGVGQSQVMDRA